MTKRNLQKTKTKMPTLRKIKSVASRNTSQSFCSTFNFAQPLPKPTHSPDNVRLISTTYSTTVECDPHAHESLYTLHESVIAVVLLCGRFIRPLVLKYMAQIYCNSIDPVNSPMYYKPIFKNLI